MSRGRIGVDATSWENRRGFGRFARNVLTRLVELDRETTYVFVGEGSFPRGVEARRVRSAAPSAGATRPLRELVSLARAGSDRSLGAFLFPSVYSWFPVVGPRVVLGVHDTTALDHAGLTLPGRLDRLAWALKHRVALRQAARVFTVSESARAELAGRLGLAPDRVAVVPEAPDPVFRPRAGGAGDYLLYAAGLSPHKNVETLLAAYAGLADAPRLVLVGGDDPYLSSRASVERRIAELGLGGRVELAGYVEDERLAELYSGALAVVCPSLAEGFGLPPVEAAACGAAVVLSDIPAHRESLGDDALYFPPRDAEALRAQLEAVLGDGDLRRRLGERARARVSRLSWDAGAEVLRSLLAEVAR